MLEAILGVVSKQRLLGSVVPGLLQKGKPRWETSLDKTSADVTKFSYDYWAHKVGYVKLRY